MLAAAATGLGATVPGDAPVLHGLPPVVAWTSAVLVATSLVTGGQSMAPLAVATPTLVWGATLADEAAPGAAAGASLEGLLA